MPTDAADQCLGGGVQNSCFAVMDTSTSATATADSQAIFRSVRQNSLGLTEGLELDDYCMQPMVNVSPLKWHLAHTSWFFETFLLKPFLPGYRVFHESFEYLFNSYYNTIGKQFPRASRGTLSRPTVSEVLQYRRSVDEAMCRLFDSPASADETVLGRTILGLHHEQQHQELMVTDLKYSFGVNPLLPTFAGARLPAAGSAQPLAFIRFPETQTQIGANSPASATSYADFVFDNETPSHEQRIYPFALANRCVTNGEYLAFMEDGGYQRPELWLADGWQWIRDACPHAPLYWHKNEDGWFEYTLAGQRSLDLHAPVVHLNFYEADACARWAGCRLPTEIEWEHAAATASVHLPGGHVENGVLHPLAQQSAAQAAEDLHMMLGNCWEWTASAYQPYPGYEPDTGALGEYNGKFMCNQQVLRGGSCATSRAHLRASYRNFLYPADRWQFSGVRFARNS